MSNLLANVVVCLKVAILLFCCLLLSSNAYSQSRVALVIGNQSYKAAPLRNPINDARAMSQMLKSRLGFEVVELHDAKLGEMTQQLRQFINKVENGSDALVYFAGHGAQYEEKNYLFPVNFEADFAEDLPYTSLPLQTILDKLNRKNKNGANIILLDACRNNPLMSKDRSYMRGLAEVKLRPNSYIAYATLPNGVASDNPRDRNGLFTQSLLKHMPTKGTNLDAMIRRVRNDVHKASGGRQTPYGVNLLREEFCFNGCLTSSTPTLATNPPSKKFAELEQLAKQGNANAQHRLARIYHSFHADDAGFPNVKPNDKLAFYWLERAATNGHASAQASLAWSYQDGEIGLTKDYKKAFNWFQLSAKQNFIPAQFALARLLQKGGYGIKRNDKLAFYWLEKAASSQDSMSQVLLGYNYCVGQGVSKSLKLCATWVSKGFANPNAETEDKDFALAIWKKYDLGRFHAGLSDNRLN